MPTIHAQPFEFHFPEAHTALLIIDMQRDFLEPGGFGATLGNDVSLLRSAIAPTRALLDAFRSRGLRIFHTREGHNPELTDCPAAKRSRGNPSLRIGDPGPLGRILIQGEPGHAIIPELAPLPEEIVLDKPGKGAFYATDLGSLLGARGITHLVIAGVTTEVCVQTTMREANDRGFSCLLVEDATASYFPAFKAATLDMITSQGAIVGWTAHSTAVLDALGVS